MRARESFFKLAGLCLLAGVLVAGLIFPVAGSMGVLTNQASDTIDKLSANVLTSQPPLITTLTDVNGKPIAYLYDQYRVPTAPDEISQTMKDAMISIEDRRFYDHQGVDVRGTLRALISNQTGGDTQGGSTLTQQFVKNYLINVSYRNNKAEQQRAQETSVARKVREARIAVQLEQQMSKDEILAGYLNVVEFSQQVYGVGAAAHAYFGTTPDKLNVTQSALLAGMVNNPTMLDPWNYPKEALERRNGVIDRMVRDNKIAPADAEEAKQEDLGVLPEPDKPDRSCLSADPKYGFFCQYVEDYLSSAGIDKDTLYSGGYTIKTTLDPKITNEAKRAAEAGVPKTQEGVANTLSVVRPGKDKHRVAALVANRDYGVNAEAGQTTYGLPYRVANNFGAGSIFKTFTAAAALEHGRGIQQTVPVPGTFVSSKFGGGGPNCPTGPTGIVWYCVSNTGDYSGSMTLQDALAQSPNTAFVALEEEVGMKPVVEMASRLGLRNTMSNTIAGAAPDPEADREEDRLSQLAYYGPSENSPGKASFTLGPGAVSGLELANVSATLMSGGTWCPPTPIEEITDRNGDPVKIQDQPCEQVVSEPLANSMVQGMSKDDTPGGTSYNAASNAGWSRPMLGKTGTTQDNKSAAFIGATPQLAAAAMTFPDGSSPQGLCGTPPQLCGANGGDIFGGKTPATTWFDAMGPIHAGMPEKPLPPADPRYEFGGPTITVPYVLNWKVEDAKGALAKAGYTVEVKDWDSTSAAGTVLGQTPMGVTGPGGKITLYVSTGNDPKPETVGGAEPQPGTPPDATNPAPPPAAPGDDEGGDG
ncbi:membrane peptidoglycan carboxypeptidase [Tamaricihabitans halophyticus]|uniref:Membrane peptidoglycan carboxypeptidase n=1 Tax=Tamaricihabitans halophyticus TaxID=1262583 RepID=A0A4V2SV26_9PSEU|nr:transglycosylase domain-containing protein [Tamaricihabitans halophyticus]TCP56886.1 membrane peptidoglycan carboxypeptidase [Tamaricihabitans halophyticus]